MLLSSKLISDISKYLNCNKEFTTLYFDCNKVAEKSITKNGSRSKYDLLKEVVFDQANCYKGRSLYIYYCYRCVTEDVSQHCLLIRI